MQDRGQQRSRRRAPGSGCLPGGGFGLAVLAAATLGPGLAGCGSLSWDEITSRDFHFKNMFDKPAPPLVVLRDSNDGDCRARALRRLQEPLQHGGTRDDQQVYVEVLTRACWNERQALGRLAAIQTLREYKDRDPRIVEGLKEAYYRAGSFNPETAAIIRCAALDALGQTGQPAAVELLVKVLREPPVEGPELDRQLKTGERIAAARALGNFKQYQATSALVQVLQAEREVALRNRAHESLRQCTGKDFPADANVWADYLRDPAGTEKSLAGSRTWKDDVLSIVPAGWRK